MTVVEINSTDLFKNIDSFRNNKSEWVIEAFIQLVVISIKYTNQSKYITSQKFFHIFFKEFSSAYQ